MMSVIKHLSCVCLLRGHLSPLGFDAFGSSSRLIDADWFPQKKWRMCLDVSAVCCSCFLIPLMRCLNDASKRLCSVDYFVPTWHLFLFSETTNFTSELLLLNDDPNQRFMRVFFLSWQDSDSGFIIIIISNCRLSGGKKKVNHLNALGRNGCIRALETVCSGDVDEALRSLYGVWALFSAPSSPLLG